MNNAIKTNIVLIGYIGVWLTSDQHSKGIHFKTILVERRSVKKSQMKGSELDIITDHGECSFHSTRAIEANNRFVAFINLKVLSSQKSSMKCKDEH